MLSKANYKKERKGELTGILRKRDTRKGLAFLSLFPQPSST